MPAVNERVIYRAVAGDCWDATVLAVTMTPTALTLVNISVMGPGLRKPIELHDICWYDEPDAPFVGARPRKPEHVCWCGEKHYPPRAEA
jgi:hypothetical protein